MLLLKPRLSGQAARNASLLHPLRASRVHKLATYHARSGLIIRAPASFSEIKSEAEQAYERARELLPALEEAQRISHDAQEPAKEAERVWQDAHSRLSDVSNQGKLTFFDLFHQRKNG
jgi:hypothetical protein